MNKEIKEDIKPSTKSTKMGNKVAGEFKKQNIKGLKITENNMENTTLKIGDIVAWNGNKENLSSKQLYMVQAKPINKIIDIKDNNVIFETGYTLPMVAVKIANEQEMLQYQYEEQVKRSINPAKYDLQETSTSASSGQYSSKYFVDGKNGKGKKPLYKGGVIIEPNTNTHDSGVNSFKVIKGKLNESEMKQVDELLVKNLDKLIGDGRKFKIKTKDGRIAVVSYLGQSVKDKTLNPKQKHMFKSQSPDAEGYDDVFQFDDKETQNKVHLYTTPNDKVTEENMKEQYRTNVNKKYTHFAVRKSNNMIVNGWDYKGTDKDDIIYYSKMDLNDIFPDNKLSEFKILSVKALEKQGINPFDWDSWEKTNPSGRINDMVNNWNNVGVAFSNVNNDDSEFFKAIGVSASEIGTASDTGVDIFYYDVNKYSDSKEAHKAYFNHQIKTHELDETTTSASSGAYTGKLMAKVGKSKPTYPGGQLVSLMEFNTDNSLIGQYVLYNTERNKEVKKAKISKIGNSFMNKERHYINLDNGDKIIMSKDDVNDLQNDGKVVSQYLSSSNPVRLKVLPMLKFGGNLKESIEKIAKEFNITNDKVESLIKESIVNNNINVEDTFFNELPIVKEEVKVIESTKEDLEFKSYVTETINNIKDVMVKNGITESAINDRITESYINSEEEIDKILNESFTKKIKTTYLAKKIYNEYVII